MKDKNVEGPFTNYVGSLRWRGGQKKSHFCLLCLICLPMKGGRGVKNSKNHAYVVYGRSLCKWTLNNHETFAISNTISHHRGQNSKWIDVAKYVSKFLIYGAKMLDKCVENRKKNFDVVLFCKSRLSKMASTKANKIKIWTPIFFTSLS